MSQLNWQLLISKYLIEGYDKMKRIYLDKNKNFHHLSMGTLG